MAKVAVILATYNGEQYIAEQLDSILANTFQEIEIYVCDDGSTDHTLEIVSGYEQTNPGKVHLCPNEKNLGVIRNFIFAVNRFEADYYLFSDQDDFWEPYKIEHSINKIKDNETEDESVPIVMFGDATVVDQDLKTIAPSFHKHGNLNPYATDLPHLLMENKLIGCTMAFNKEVKKYLKEVPETVRMHDWWIGLIGSAFGKVLYLEEPLLKYRQHGDNTLGSMTEVNYIAKNINNLKKQREAVYANCKQGQAMLDCFSDILTEEQKQTLTKLATLPEKSWIYRKHTFLHNGYKKTGFLKNMGVFVLI